MHDSYPNLVLHQLDQKIIYPHYDLKHLTEKYFEIGMKLNDFSIQLVKYCNCRIDLNFKTASKTLKGIEAMNMIKKRQVNNLNYSVLNEVKYINQLFGIVV